jgi:hypothetical protein
MTLRTESCTFRQVSATSRRLIDQGVRLTLMEFTRQTLSCPRLPVCRFADCCTILSASLLSEYGDAAPLDGGDLCLCRDPVRSR